MFSFYFKYIYNQFFGLISTKNTDETSIKVIPNHLWSDHFCERFANALPELTNKAKALLPNLTNMSYVMDVNANVGELGLYLALCLQNMHSEKCIDVIMVEPDETKVAFIKQMIELNNLVNCMVIGCNVSNKKTFGKLKFDIEHPGKSLVVEDDNETGPDVVIDTIDFIAQDLKIAMIHMDINDKEYKALLGASETLESTDYLLLNMNEPNNNFYSRENERKFLKVKNFIQIPDEVLQKDNGYEIYKKENQL